MLLMTNANARPDFWAFPGRPQREIPTDRALNDPAWKVHPLAASLAAMLAERCLEEQDLELFTEREWLWAILDWPYQFSADPNCSTESDVRETLGPALDHLVAWRTRDMMIKATLEAAETAEWIIAPTETAVGRVVTTPPAGDFGAAVPTWAVTMSTVLAAFLEKVGLDPVEAIRQACEQTRGNGVDETEWIYVDGVFIHYHDGRLHAREIIGQAAVDDYYGLKVNFGARKIPTAVMAGALGRRLSKFVNFEKRFALLSGLTGLDMSTETVTAIPRSALAAVGDHRPQVPRSEKPWLRARVPTLSVNRYATKLGLL